jgi:AmmeMemoRadiSam system protein A
MKLTNEDGKDLIKLARDAISAVLDEKDLKADKTLKSRFSENQGVFVTLHIKGDLRGCIGFTDAVYPLWEAVVNAATAAAFQDPRFPQLTKEELPDIKIEVSVLTVPELIVGKKEDYVKKIKIGKHGLIVDTPYAKGLLLPQVFTEYKVDSAKALEMTCQKAGLAPDGWKDKDCKVFTFSCQIFNES